MPIRLSAVDAFEARLLDHHGSVQNVLSVIADPQLRFALLWRSHERVLRARPNFDGCSEAEIAQALIEAAAAFAAAWQREAAASPTSEALAPPPTRESRQEQAWRAESELARKYPDLTDALYQHLPAIQRLAERRGLDPDKASAVAASAIYRYLRAADAGLSPAHGEPDVRFLRTKLLDRAFMDQIRIDRRAGRTEESIDEDGRELDDSANVLASGLGVEREGRGWRFTQPAAPLVDWECALTPRLPRFYLLWEAEAGPRRDYIVGLRECCWSLRTDVGYSSELRHILAFLFGEDASLAGDGKSARLAVQRQLGWFQDRTPGARNAARCRLLEQLRAAWRLAWTASGWELLPAMVEPRHRA